MAAAVTHLLGNLSERAFTHITGMETGRDNSLSCTTCKANLSHSENRMDLIEHLLVKVLSIVVSIRDQMANGRDVALNFEAEPMEHPLEIV